MAMTLRLNEEQTERLRMAAERESMSMQAVAIKAIDEYTQRRTHRRDQLLAMIVEQDADVLKRLGEA